MAAINFPAAPTNGQLYTENGVTYEYVTAITAWNRVPATFINSGSFVYYTGALNVGVGTATPGSKFSVQGTTSLNGAVDVTGDFLVGTTDFFVNDTLGRVGIGTVAPETPLNVIGNVMIGTYASTTSGELLLTGTTANKQAVLKCTNGNLHIDANTGGITYLNFYAGSGTIFGNGASGGVAVMGPDGDLWKGASDNTGDRYFNDGYHPNADAWTTGRTITLTGDATGVSASWTGSGNISFATTVLTASTTVAGKVELATVSEYQSKDTTRALTSSRVFDAAAEETVTYGATVTFNMNLLFNGVVTMTGNGTLDFTNIKAGQAGHLRVVQDVTGSRTMAYTAECEFAGGTAPVLTTTANAEDVIFYKALTATRVFISTALDVK